MSLTPESIKELFSKYSNPESLHDLNRELKHDFALTIERKSLKNMDELNSEKNKIIYGYQNLLLKEKPGVMKSLIIYGISDAARCYSAGPQLTIKDENQINFLKESLNQVIETTLNQDKAVQQRRKEQGDPPSILHPIKPK